MQEIDIDSRLQFWDLLRGCVCSIACTGKENPPSRAPTRAGDSTQSSRQLSRLAETLDYALGSPDHSMMKCKSKPALFRWLLADSTSRRLRSDSAKGVCLACQPQVSGQDGENLLYL
jgi:hypothetical protein